MQRITILPHEHPTSAFRLPCVSPFCTPRGFRRAQFKTHKRLVTWKHVGLEQEKHLSHVAREAP